MLKTPFMTPYARGVGGAGSTVEGTNTNPRGGRAWAAAYLVTTNGTTSSEESIRVKSWWVDPHCGLSTFDDGDRPHCQAL